MSGKSFLTIPKSTCLEFCASNYCVVNITKRPPYQLSHHLLTKLRYLWYILWLIFGICGTNKSDTFTNHKWNLFWVWSISSSYLNRLQKRDWLKLRVWLPTSVTVIHVRRSTCTIVRCMTVTWVLKNTLHVLIRETFFFVVLFITFSN